MMTMKEIAMAMGVTEEEWNAFADEPVEEQIEITMTKSEIIKRLEELDREGFFLSMKDVWTVRTTKEKMKFTQSNANSKRCWRVDTPPSLFICLTDNNLSK